MCVPYQKAESWAISQCSKCRTWFDDMKSKDDFLVSFLRKEPIFCPKCDPRVAEHDEEFLKACGITLDA
jgi:hypothetical protein